MQASRSHAGATGVRGYMVGAIDGDTKTPMGEVGLSPVQDRGRDVGSGCPPSEASPSPASTVPSRDTPRDVPGLGGWLAHPLACPSPRSDTPPPPEIAPASYNKLCPGFRGLPSCRVMTLPAAPTPAP